MLSKTLTVKIMIENSKSLFEEEIESPVLKKYLDQGWKIKEVYQIIGGTKNNHLLLTYNLVK